MRSPGRLRASPAELRVLRQSAGLFRNVVAAWDADGFLVGGEGAYSFITEAPGDGYLYVRNGALHDWVRLPADGAGVTISVIPPVNPLPGWLWFDPVGTQLYVWYDDGTSQQWVVAVNNGGGAAAGGRVTVSLTAPTAAEQGDLWFDPAGTQLYVYYDDGSSSQWVAASNNGSGVGGGIPEAPLIGGPYGRQAGNWVTITAGIGEAPLIGGPYGRQASNWVDLTIHGGVF